MTQTGLASAVNQGTSFGHAHAFERRYSICHSKFKNTVIGPAGSNRLGSGQCPRPLLPARIPAPRWAPAKILGVSKSIGFLQVQ
jgi:hypothetical protein